MADRWPVKTIAECAADEPYATQIGPFGKALMADEYTDSGVPVLRGVNVNTGRFHDDDFVFISEETADRLAKFESFPGDVLLVHKGTLGQIGLMPSKRRYPRYIMGNSMLRVRCDPAKLFPEYLYYWLSSAAGRHYLLSRVSQVGVPQIQKPLSTLREAELPVPPILEQEHITEVLGSIDDKIELNRRVNISLEEMAWAIFKAWFIDFEPIKAKEHGASKFYDMSQNLFCQLPDSFTDRTLHFVPEGWGISTISNIAEYVNGKAFTQHANGRGRLIIRIAELNSGPGKSSKYSDIDTLAKHTASPDDILFAWSGSLDVHRWHGEEAIVNQHIFKVIPKDLPGWYVYYRLVEAMPFFQTIAAAKATTMGHIKRNHLDDVVFAEPPTWYIDAADEHIRPLYELVHVNEQESLRLIRIRDTLAPALLSGEIEALKAK